MRVHAFSAIVTQNIITLCHLQEFQSMDVQHEIYILVDPLQ
jgi:hypothetical protein